MRQTSVAVALVTFGLVCFARASAEQYTAIEQYQFLPPVQPVPPGSASVAPLPLGSPGATFIAAGGEVVGPFGPGNRVFLWNGPFPPIDLTPAGFDGAFAFGTNGVQQVGSAYRGGYNPPDAMLWNGSAASVVDLNPTKFGSFQSVALATDGTNQVGYGGPDLRLGGWHALMWSGNANSVIDLHPAGFTFSQAWGVGGNQEVGGGSINQSLPHALLWAGSASSVVDLHPTGYVNSGAWGTNGAQQVGYAGLADGFDHAMLWSGTAASAVDLNPTNLNGYSESFALATNGSIQVGYGRKGSDLVSLHSPQALLWHGSADSATDLGALLPGSLNTSVAQSVSLDGNVFGVANDASFSTYAVEWVPHAVIPGDTNLDGRVDFADLLELAQYYGRPGGWPQGNFDWHSTVDFSDLLILAQHYGQSLPAVAPTAASPLPEPIAISAFVAACLLRRCRAK